MHVEILVRFSAGAYVTNVVHGVRASSTSGPETAAASFGQKYFGPSFVCAAPMSAEDAHVRSFLVVGDEEEVAYCWNWGRIDFGPRTPAGAIAFARGPRRALRAMLDVAARHGQGDSEGLLLVPGVPEAPTPEAAIDALVAFVDWRAKGGSQHRVIFSRSIDL